MALKYLSPLHRATRQIALWFEEQIPDRAAAEGHLLTYLVPYGPCPVSELVRVFGTKHSTMTSMLDRLEESGLVERKPNPNDKRSLLIAATAKGKRAAARVSTVVEQLERAIDARVSKADLAGFQKVLEAIDGATKVKVR